jgi:hypothetical protein
VRIRRRILEVAMGSGNDDRALAFKHALDRVISKRVD